MIRAINGSELEEFQLAPNFFILGAAKSGTTALQQYLVQHPDIFMSEPKEPHFFAFPGMRLEFMGPGDDETINRNAITDRNEYYKLFEKSGKARMRGEASVSYLYYSQTAKNIKKAHPEARLLMVLRNPARRAFSAFSFLRTRLFEPHEDFILALAEESRRIDEGWHHMWHYQAMGFYYEQVQRYFHLFPKEQIKIYLFEEFIQSPARILRDCFEFLGVDPAFKPRFTPTPHRSGRPRNRFLSRFLSREHPIKTLLKPLVGAGLKNRIKSGLSTLAVERQSVPKGAYHQLMLGYRDDIEALSQLLRRDLSAWTPKSPI